MPTQIDTRHIAAQVILAEQVGTADHTKSEEVRVRDAYRTASEGITGGWCFDGMGQPMRNAFGDRSAWERQIWREAFYLMYNNRSLLDEDDLARAPMIYEALKEDADGRELFIMKEDQDKPGNEVRIFRPQIEFEPTTGRFARQWDLRGRRVTNEGEAPQERHYVVWALDSEGNCVRSFNEDLCEGDMAWEEAVASTPENAQYRSEKITVYPFTRTRTVLGLEQRILAEDVAHVVCYMLHPTTVDEARDRPGQVIVRLKSGQYARIVANMLSVEMDKECGFFITSPSFISLFGMHSSKLFM